MTTDGRTSPRREDRVPTLLVTGAPGAGKTALARELSEMLARIGEPHALVDLDELTRGVLPEGSLDFNLSLAVENLAAIWENFRKRGARRALLARVILSVDEVGRFASAIPGSEVTVCRIVSEAGVEDRRIRERDPGISASFVAEVASDVEEQMAGLHLPGFTVHNGSATSITELAREVLRRAQWPAARDDQMPTRCRTGPARSPR
jgi:hypothetical protein